MSVVLVALSNGPLLSPKVVMPIAALLLVVIGLHMNALAAAPIPPSRRRIRLANGWLMLLTTPMAAFAFGMASPNNARVFLLVWLSVVGLIAIIVMLAVIDLVNTRRLFRQSQAELREEIRRLERENPPGNSHADDRIEPGGTA